MMIRYHALVYFALATAGQTTAFQPPKPATKAKASLDVSFVERSLDQPGIFSPAEALLAPDPIGFKRGDKPSAGRSPEKSHGAAYQGTSMQRFAESAAVGQEQARALAMEVSNTIEEESPEQARSFAVEVSNTSEEQSPSVNKITYEEALDKVARGATGLTKLVKELVNDSVSFVATEVKNKSEEAIAVRSALNAVGKEASSLPASKAESIPEHLSVPELSVVFDQEHKQTSTPSVTKAESTSTPSGTKAEFIPELLSALELAVVVDQEQGQEQAASSALAMGLSKVSQAREEKLPTVDQQLSVAVGQEQVSPSELAMDSLKVSTAHVVEEQSPTVNQDMSIAVVKDQDVVVQEQGASTALALDLSKVSNVLSPAEAFEALVQKGEYNAASSTAKILFSAGLGGCYVGMGAMVSLAVAGNSPDLAAADPGRYKFLFAALFPMNLLLAQQCGGSLYTGNTANMMAALCEKRVSLGDMGRVLGLSWIGNVVGCSVFALLCKYAGVLEGGAGALAAATLVTKTSYELGPLIVKAVFCNWLVCLAVLLSTQAKDMGGKYISIWLPVSTFVSIGFEHSVANMFLLPAGLMSQNDITLQTAIVHNLIPVTIGNAFSGALLVGATMSYLYGSLGREDKK